MAERRFTKDHEWIEVDGDIGTVGISEFAQNQLGDVVYVEIAPGKKVAAGGEAGVVESVKAASEIYSPVSGEIVEFNGDLEAEPGKINEAPYGGGWLFKIKLSDPGELSGLMSEDDYKAYVADLD